MIIFTAGLALELPCRTLKTFYVFGITTLWTSISSLMFLVWIKSFLVGWSMILVLHLRYLFWLFDLDLWECCFCLLLLCGRSVLWCLIRFTWATWGLLATYLMCLVVDFEDLVFLASCITLLAGNFSRSILESLMVLESNPWSFRKKQKISPCNDTWQFLVGTWQETCEHKLHCTTHLQNIYLVWSLSAGQIWL